jgi:hypothetical protein
MEENGGKTGKSNFYIERDKSYIKSGGGGFVVVEGKMYRELASAKRELANSKRELTNSHRAVGGAGCGFCF